MKPAPMSANFEDYEHLRFSACWKRTGDTVEYCAPVLARLVGNQIDYGGLFAYLFLRWGVPNCPWVHGQFGELSADSLRDDMLRGVTPTFNGKADGGGRFYGPGGT